MKPEDQERLDALLAAVRAATPTDMHDKIVHRVRTSFKKITESGVLGPKNPRIVDLVWRDTRALSAWLKGTLKGTDPRLNPKMRERIIDAVTARGTPEISEAELTDYIGRLVNEFDYPKSVTAKDLHAKADKSVIGNMPLKTFQNRATAANKG